MAWPRQIPEPPRTDPDRTFVAVACTVTATSPWPRRSLGIATRNTIETNVQVLLAALRKFPCNVY
jgi:hypothetical protein